MFIKLKLKSLHLKYFFIECTCFIYLLYNFNFKLLKIVILHLPKKVKKFCVIRSPFVSKTSKEHFKLEFFNFLLLLEFLNIIFYIFYKKKLLSFLILYYFYIKIFYLEIHQVYFNLTC